MHLCVLLFKNWKINTLSEILAGLTPLDIDKAVKKYALNKNKTFYVTKLHVSFEVRQNILGMIKPYMNKYFTLIIIVRKLTYISF